MTAYFVQVTPFRILPAVARKSLGRAITTQITWGEQTRKRPKLIFDRCTSSEEPVANAPATAEAPVEAPAAEAPAAAEEAPAAAEEAPAAAAEAPAAEAPAAAE